MTDPPDPSAEAIPEPVEATPAEPAPDLAALRSEAGAWRRRLRATEAERDALAARVDARDRVDVERQAGAKMASGSDIWTGGVELAELRGDDGALAPELVDAAVARVLADRPHWAAGPKAASFDGGARTTPATGGPSFGDALKRASG